MWAVVSKWRSTAHASPQPGPSGGFLSSGSSTVEPWKAQCAVRLAQGVAGYDLASHLDLHPVL